MTPDNTAIPAPGGIIEENRTEDYRRRLVANRTTLNEAEGICMASRSRRSMSATIRSIASSVAKRSAPTQCSAWTLSKWRWHRSCVISRREGRSGSMIKARSSFSTQTALCAIRSSRPRRMGRFRQTLQLPRRSALSTLAEVAPANHGRLFKIIQSAGRGPDIRREACAARIRSWSPAPRMRTSPNVPVHHTRSWRRVLNRHHSGAPQSLRRQSSRAPCRDP